MFEKEAEEFVPNINWHAYSSKEIREEMKRCYRKGAEKASEWHKVADGDLPKAGQKCYFIYSNVYGKDNKVSFSKSDINVLTGIYAFFLDEEGEETSEPCFYDDINDEEINLKEVYAWKEIVLPELPKEQI